MKVFEFFSIAFSDTLLLSVTPPTGPTLDSPT